jgi:hypothetical protein
MLLGENRLPGFAALKSSGCPYRPASQRAASLAW